MGHIDVTDLQDSFVLERDSPDVNDDGTFGGPPSTPSMPADLADQLKEVLKALAKAAGQAPPDKRQRDGTIRSVLARCIDALVKGYPTTLEEDQRLLANAEQMPPRQRMAVQVRYGEKVLLREASQSLLSRK